MGIDLAKFARKAWYSQSIQKLVQELMQKAQNFFSCSVPMVFGNHEKLVMGNMTDDLLSHEPLSFRIHCVSAKQMQMAIEHDFC